MDSRKPTLVGFLIGVLVVILLPACSAQVTTASCDHFVVSYLNLGSSSNNGLYTFTAYAGKTSVGSATQFVSTGPGSVTIPIQPPQSNGTLITVGVSGPGGSFPNIASGQCSATASTWFNPGDGRVEPLPGDRVTAYCDIPDGLITVYIVKPDSNGVKFGVFNYKDVLAAGGKGLSITSALNGVVSLSVDKQNNFWLAWNGGQYSADGQPNHGFAKGFNCAFSK
jgi:hypothetical protein